MEQKWRKVGKRRGDRFANKRHDLWYGSPKTRFLKNGFSKRNRDFHSFGKHPNQCIFLCH